MIYIDPPYNTGNKDWVYNDHYVGANDRYRHSQWLEFLYQRLTLARDLLTPDGVIMMSINDENRSRLELLMDEVMPGRRVGSFAWKTRSGSNDKSGFQLSLDHEHILIYANPGFAFSGQFKDFSQYKNPDNDSRGRWKTGDLSKSHTLLERPNGYYPIKNPVNGVWYPCNPSRVWAFASENIIDPSEVLQAKTMEQYIREDKVIFPTPEAERVVTWNSKAELLAAIAKGDVPLRPKNKTPLITADLPDLDFWVGKAVGFGRPWFKRHLVDLQSEVRPVSSWIRGASEEENLDEFAVGLVSQRSGTGEHSVNEILGFNAFPYPKPLSLIKTLLQQATRPNDIILDFFAGSGTTGQAVLELNAEDEGSRRFILCSSTEATGKEPDKNLCRDVCAERIRRVMQGYGNKPALGGSFAYLQLDKIEAADVPFDASNDHAAQLLSLRHQQTALVTGHNGKLTLIANDGQIAIVLANVVDEDSMAQLLAWPAERLVVYSSRPQTVSQQFADADRDVISYSLEDALLRGQTTQRGATQ
ncbi:hypothetical protein JHS3_00940 [Jeongeupia sp. HS-3]|uniref:site-specific DNA-methyltransferase n=1 Tax=Jeongeupia sp. HS-3 TaxID=1009682 RepID=UPI0018A65C50|nr:site-specific DNA-methyltransferase [Jeongeupia sp. HS-3]BCL74358.1 hypothetical protein JHS3_00940 [Jeongeupia sp. HS-3]